MSRVLIAGCGYVGSATADLFHARGWTVEGWTGSDESAQALAAKPYPVRAVDLTSDRLPAEGSFDAVIQSASTRGGNADDYRRIYLRGAQNLAAAFPDALLVFTSSTSVYAQTSGEWVTEESPAKPAHDSGRVLRETEEFVLSRDGVVARLAGIYGPGRSALLRKFLSSTATIESEDRFVNQAHRDDIAAALLLLVERALHAATTRRQIYNIADGNPMTLRDCYGWLAAQLGRPLPSIGERTEQRKRGRSNKRVSSAKLQALGWTPKYPNFASAMGESILPNLATCGA